MKQILKVGALCLMVMLLFSCSTMPGKVNPMAKMVPADAVFYAEVRDFETALTNFDDFVSGTMIESILGKEGSKAIMDQGFTGMGLSTEWFDLTGSFGIAIAPSEGGLMTNPNIIVMVPLLDAVYIENIKEAVGDESLVKLIGNYAVICSMAETSASLPVKKGLDLSPFSGANAGDVAFYLDFQGYLEAMGLSMDTLRATVSMAMMSANTVMDEKYTKLSGSVFDMYFDFFEQIDSVYTCLTLDGSGLTSFGSLFYKEGMGIAEWGKKLAPKSGIKDSLGYMNSDSLVAFAANMDLSVMEDLYGYLFNKLLGSPEMDQAVIDGYIAQMMDMIKNFKEKMTMSMDMNFNWEKLMALAGDLSGDQMGDASFSDIFNFSLTGVSSITNKEDVQNAYMDYIKSGLLNKLFGMYDELYGISTKVNWENNLEEGGFMYDRMSFEVSETGAEGAYKDARVQALAAKMIKDMFSQLKMYMAYKGDQMFIVMGTGGIETLKQLVDGKLPGNGKSLGDTKSFKEISSRIPGDAQMICSFSPVKFFNLFVGIPGVELTPIMLDEAPGMIGYTKITGNRWESLGFLAKDEIAALINTLMPLISSLGGF